MGHCFCTIVKFRALWRGRSSGGVLWAGQREQTQGKLIPGPVSFQEAWQPSAILPHWDGAPGRVGMVRESQRAAVHWGPSQVFLFGFGWTLSARCFNEHLVLQASRVMGRRCATASTPPCSSLPAVPPVYTTGKHLHS